AQKTPRRTQRGDKISHPNDPIKEIIRVTGIFPKTHLTNSSLIGWIVSKVFQLPVGNAFSNDPDQPHPRSNEFNRFYSRNRIHHHQGKWKRKNEREQGMEVKKTQRHRILLGAPLLA